MTTDYVNVNALPARAASTCGCGCCDTCGLERVRFFPRQILGADDLNAEQRYFREKQRRHNRYLHGWGVVCGCEVKPSPTQAKPFQVVICPGYVITPMGDEIMIGTPALFDLATCMVSSDDPCALSVPCPPVTSSTPLRSLIYLAVCYKECVTRPVRVAPAGCSCDEAQCDYSRIRDAYAFSCLGQKPAPEAGPTCEQLCDGVILGCPPCPQDNCVVLATIRLETQFVPNPNITDVALAAQYLVAENSPMKIDNLTDRRLLYSTANLQTMALCNCGTGTPVANVLQVERVALGRAASPDDPAPTVFSSLDPPATNWLYSAGKSLPNALDVTFTGATLDNSTVTLGGVPPGKKGTFQIQGPKLTGAVLGFPAANTVRLLVKQPMRGNYKFRLVGTPDATSGGQAIMSQATSSASASNLDGEIPSPPQWPSGDQQPGGDFGWIELNIS